MKSIVVLLQNDNGDKDILIRILNDLKNGKNLFAPDKVYLETVIKKYFPEDLHLLSD
jgi:hypothetical protein